MPDDSPLGQRLNVPSTILVSLVVLSLLGVSGYFIYRFLKPAPTPVTQINNVVSGSLPSGSTVFNNPVIREAFISVAGTVSRLDAGLITLQKDDRTYSFKPSASVKYYSSIPGLASPSLADIKVGTHLSGLLKLSGTEFVATTLNLLPQ